MSSSGSTRRSGAAADGLPVSQEGLASPPSHSHSEVDEVAASVIGGAQALSLQPQPAETDNSPSLHRWDGPVLTLPLLNLPPPPLIDRSSRISPGEQSRTAQRQEVPRPVSQLPHRQLPCGADLATPRFASFLSLDDDDIDAEARSSASTIVHAASEWRGASPDIATDLLADAKGSALEIGSSADSVCTTRAESPNRLVGEAAGEEGEERLATPPPEVVANVLTSYISSRRSKSGCSESSESDNGDMDAEQREEIRKWRMNLNANVESLFDWVSPECDNGTVVS